MYQDFFDKNDDYLNEFKQKVANQKIATVEERRSELARSRNNFLSIFAGITLAGVVGWFVLSPQYTQESSELPIIRRPQTAVKIRPENPGGMEIPNQDKDVYSIVEKKTIDNTVVENLLPTPETPKLPDIVPEVSDIDENAKNLDEIVDEVAEEKTTAEEVSEAIEEKVEKTKETVNETIPEKPIDLLNKEETKPAEKVEIKKEEKPAEKIAETTQAPAQQTGGNWQIQLIASKNKDAVEKAWNDLSNRYSLLKSYSHEIQTSDLGAQGIFYRLRAGSFADKNAAAAACAALKKQGLNDCITKER
jgi:cell division septation protein DedD